MFMNSLEYGLDGIERRSGIDRRRNKPRVLSWYWIKGRRGVPRRQADRKHPQVIDRYNPKFLLIIIGILLLSILDAVLTLILIKSGAKELNPILDFYLGVSPWLFVFIKYFLTSAAVILILCCKDFYLFKTKTKAKVLFFFLPLPFLLVIPWQLTLICLFK